MYFIENMPSQIDIGFTGEKKFRKIPIDMSAWMEEMPEGVPSIVHIRPTETTAEAYIANTTFENNILTWEITAGDLGSTEGVGTAQVWLEEEASGTINKRGKSILFATIIHGAINDAGETVPSAQAAWMEQMTALKTATVNAKNAAEAAVVHEPTVDTETGNWLVWDQTTSQYVDTGITSRGQLGAKSIVFELDDVENVSGAYSHSTTIEAATNTMKPIALEVGSPNVFGGNITVTCDNGSISVSCDSVSGTSTLKVICEEMAQSPYEPFVTSEEFALLDGRIGLLADLETEDKSSIVAAINEIAEGGGGDPTEIIDDTAGAGDTDKVFSADKLTTDFSSVLNAITNNATEEDLLRSEMPGTSTTVTTDSDGNPTSIVHTANSATVRTDTFVWGTGTVTETRTLANGKYITITTNLDTLAQTISAVQEVA